jgi:hypothetical protein
MRLPTLIFLLSFSTSIAHSQQNFLRFKKGRKTISTYWKGSTISFLTTNDQWQKGEITRIANDSFYIRPMVVRYHLMGTDTVHYSVIGFSMKDVFAMPNKGILIHYVDGTYQISRSGGHVKWYWVKSGWIFRVGAVGYAGLHVANGLIKDDFSLSRSKPNLITAAAVFLGGVLLHKSYKPYLPLGRKYQLERFNLSE